jgi:hypothetical protein
METKIAKTVRAFRAALAQEHSTFFLVYTDSDLATGAVRTMVTSNSTTEGISAILGLLLEPTDAAVDLLELALASEIADEADLQENREHARLLLDQLRKMFTVKGLESLKKPII